MNHSKRRRLEAQIAGHEHNLAAKRLPPAVAHGTRFVLGELRQQLREAQRKIR